METTRVSSGQVSDGLVQGVPVSVVEGALETFAGADGYAELPVLAFVPLVNESDWREEEEPIGLVEVLKEFARNAISPWRVARKRGERVPML